VLDFSEKNHFVATEGKDGCAVEVRWDAGAMTSMFADPDFCLRRRILLEVVSMDQVI
jgi:hypothetical protein